MRSLLGLGALLAAAGAAAQTPAPPFTPPMSPATAAAPTADDAAALVRQLDAARAEIQQLRRQLADTAPQAAALAEARARNARLVTIGNELIAAFLSRYASGAWDPFQLARAKFEAELQAKGEQIYQNQVDAGPVRADPPAPPASERQTVAKPR